jgi:hypothetical protein
MPKLTIRMPDGKHARLKALARSDSVSLNKLRLKPQGCTGCNRRAHFTGAGGKLNRSVPLREPACLLFWRQFFPACALGAAPLAADAASEQPNLESTARHTRTRALKQQLMIELSNWITKHQLKQADAAQGHA